MDFESSNGPSGGERREHFSTSEPGSYPYSESKMGSQRATSGVSQQHDSDIIYSECLLEISTVFHEIYCRWDLDGIELTNMGGLKLTSVWGISWG